MKRILFAVYILFIGAIGVLKAESGDVLLLCDFEDGVPEGWHNLDLDGLMLHPKLWSNSGYTYLGPGTTDQLKCAWGLTNDSYTGNCVMSGSWFSSSNYARADDWLVTPNISISDDGALVSWMAKSAAETSSEDYEVRVILSDDFEALLADYENEIVSATMFSSNLVKKSVVISSVKMEKDIWTKREELLTQYKGEDIRIVWRNNTQSRFAVILDNIVVTEGESGVAPQVGPWTESFKFGRVPSLWMMDVVGWKTSSKWHSGQMLPDYKGMDMIWFDVFYTKADQQGSVTTSAFRPIGTCYKLQYDVEKMVVSYPQYIKPGLAMYVEASTDRGQTFISSDYNVLQDLPDYSGEVEVGSTIGKVTLETDLSEYLNQDIIVRFRLVSNNGSEDIILWQVRMVESESIVPVAMETVPANGVQDVPLDTEISVQFEQKIKALDLSKITLMEKGGASLEIEPTVNWDKIFIAHDGLKNGAEYEVRIPLGAVAYMEGDFTWSFITIGDNKVMTVAPENGAKEVEVDAQIFITCENDIILNSTDNVVIKTDKDEKINVLKVTADGKKLSISHEELKYNAVHTVTVPAGTIDGIEYDYSWSFTTKSLVGVDPLTATVMVYPTITTGNVRITSTANVGVKVFDITGRLLQQQTVPGDLNIMLDYPNGLYLVVIEEGGRKVSTHKIVLKR